MAQRSLVPPAPFDLRRTMRALGIRRDAVDGGYWYATRTDSGAATVVVTEHAGVVAAEAWGPGAAELLDSMPRLLGFDDAASSFLPTHPAVRDLHRRAPGLHLGSTGKVYESIVPTVLGQLVTSREAMAGFRALLRGLGEPAPGPPAAPRLVPAPDVLAAVSYADLHGYGIERKRARVLIECARRAKRLEECLSMAPRDARARLLAVRGVGPWTAETVMGVAYGDRDAVPPGDYNLPHMVSWALAGEPRGSDERMFELLEPFRPVRRRVMVLLKQAGVHAPRFGPRRPIRTHL